MSNQILPSPSSSPLAHPSISYTRDSEDVRVNFDENTPVLCAKSAGDGGGSTPEGDGNDKEKKGSDFAFFNLPARSKSILLLCSFSNFAISLSLCILGPFFPEEATKKGLSTTTIGLIFSVFALVIFVSSPIYGNFLTRLGTRFVLTTGICVGGCCSILFGLLDKSPGGITFAGLCFACRTLEALSMSAFITASFAVLSNEFPKHVATVLGISETASGIGYIVGPAVGGVLYELGGYGLPFFVVGGLIIIAGVVLDCLLPKVEEVELKRKGSVSTLMFSPMVIIALYSIIMCSLCMSFLEPLLAKHLDPFDLSAAVVGLVFLLASLLYALCSPFYGYLVDNKHFIALLIVPGHLIYAVAFFLVGPSPWLPFVPFKLWVVILAMCLFGFGVGCISVPNIKCLVLGALEVGFEDNLDTYAVVSGLFQSVYNLGAFVGPTLGGVLQQQLGFDLSATVLAVANLVACLVTLVFFTQRHFLKKRQQTPSPPGEVAIDEPINNQGYMSVREDNIESEGHDDL